MVDVTLDNCMEWITGQRRGAVTFSQRKWVAKLLRYAEDYPDDIEIVAQNADGSVFAHVPISWFKFSPPRKGREMSEEEKIAAGERMKAARAKKKHD